MPQQEALVSVEMLKFVLRKALNPRLVERIVDDMEEAIADGTLHTGGTAETLHIGGGGGGGEGTKKRKSSGKPRKSSAFTFFISMAMNYISSDEHKNDPAVQVVDKIEYDEAGNPKTKRGVKMTVASGMWSALTPAQKETFHNVFRPLCEQLDEESQRTGQKNTDLYTRVKEFKSTLHPGTQREIDQLFDYAKDHNTKAGGHHEGPSGAGFTDELDEGGAEEEAAAPPPAKKQELKKSEAKKDGSLPKKTKKGDEGKPKKSKKPAAVVAVSDGTESSD